jgi:anti-anti-sigma factor
MEVAPACRFGRRVDPTSVQAREVQREIVVGIERAPVARWMIVNLDPIIAQQAPDVAAVAPSGVLEGTTVDELRAALTSLLGERRTKLLVDLGGLANVDSSGLSMIVAVMKLARRLGGDLRLCAPRPDIHSLLDTLGLLGQIGVYPGRQEALASWLPSPPPVAPKIDRAVFLVSTKDRTGRSTTIESDVVPLLPGRSSYQWRLHLRDATPKSVTLKEILTLPTPSDGWPLAPELTSETHSRRAITEETLDARDGWISQSWRVANGDPPGPYAIDVHLDGAFIHRFVFQVRRPVDSISPPVGGAGHPEPAEAATPEAGGVDARGVTPIRGVLKVAHTRSAGPNGHP